LLKFVAQVRCTVAKGCATNQHPSGVDSRFVNNSLIVCDKKLPVRDFFQKSSRRLVVMRASLQRINEDCRPHAAWRCVHKTPAGRNDYHCMEGHAWFGGARFAVIVLEGNEAEAHSHPIRVLKREDF